MCIFHNQTLFFLFKPLQVQPLSSTEILFNWTIHHAHETEKKLFLIQILVIQVGLVRCSPSHFPRILKLCTKSAALSVERKQASHATYLVIFFQILYKCDLCAIF